MSGDVVISAEGLGKSFLIGHTAERERYTALRDVVARSLKGIARSALDLARGRQLVAGDEIEEFWALRDVSFEIRRGDVVGIIGRNGAGKSTLLKVLSRITEPSRGRVRIKGRVASLLEVGTGFHPELTGRENIFLNGAILGMTRAEIRARFDEIVAFAEIERFLDTPVKRYSSGMYVRLAFAVAAHLEPEILVVDEVLAVGDAEFQKKCLGKMQDVAGHGRTVLFVSHNMGVVSALCRSCILLEKGEIADIGATPRLMARYASQSSLSATYTPRVPAPASDLAIEHAEASTREVPGAGLVLETRVRVRARRKITASIDIRLKDAIGAPLGFTSLGALSHEDLVGFEAGSTDLVIETRVGELADGLYLLSLDLSVPNAHYFQRLEDCLALSVTRDAASSGLRPHEQGWGLGSSYFRSRVLSHSHAS